MAAPLIVTCIRRFSELQTLAVLEGLTENIHSPKHDNLSNTHISNGCFGSMFHKNGMISRFCLDFEQLNFNGFNNGHI